ncbi:hypothetical protein IW262DRAFT_1278429 [Armillaria fumosa]|nr:hypothetical protein IW262DRAFT_1278429 [Armillaria fumosa]
MSFLGNCPICLSDYKEPYSIPCGHLFCLDCLVEYISYSSRDSLTAKCPSCRDEFPLVNPELRFLPKRFHRYMIPSIRPLFIGTSPSESEGLVQKVEALEARIDILKIEKYELRRSWEKVKADAARHARGESAAKNEVERLENETTRLRELLGEALIEARLARYVSSQSLTSI